MWDAAETPVLACRNAMLAGAESAKASVESDRATTSDKTKRLSDNMDPPNAL
jgi:hypothetical protein